MKDLRDKDCSLCDLGLHCSNRCIVGEGSSKANLMIVAECPSNHDDKNETVMEATKDKLLRMVLKDAMDVDPKTVYITYLSKCMPLNGMKPDNEEAKTCFENYLVKEIDAIKPKCIVALGEQAMVILTGQKGITKKRGELFHTEVNGTKYPVVPTYLPAYAATTSNQTEAFAKDIDKAYLISEGAEVTGTEVPFTWVRDYETMEKLCDYCIEAGLCCFDFETTSLGVHNDINFKPTLLSVSFQMGHGYVIPLEHFENDVSLSIVADLMDIFNNRVLQNPKVQKINHNLKYELHCLTYFGVRDIRGRLQDTMLMHHLLDEDKRHGLKDLVAEIFPEYNGYNNEVKQYKWEEVPLLILAKYGVTDTDRTLALCIMFERMLMKDKKLYDLYRNLTMPAVRALFYAERDGMKVDVKFLEQSIEDVENYVAIQDEKLRNHKKVKAYEAWKKQDVLNNAIFEQERKIVSAIEEKNARKEAGARKKKAELEAGRFVLYEGFNFASSKQMGKLLYSEQGFNFDLPYSKKHRDNYAVTDKDALVSLKDKSGFIEALLVMRSLKKMGSTYMVGIHALLDRKNRIHTSFLIHGTETGRLSSKEPNMQNIPRSSKLNDELTKDVVGRIKKLFIPDRGCCLVQVDYSQAELRIAAEFANEPVMLKAYADNEDLHTLTAMKVNNLTKEGWEKLDKAEAKEKRQNAKPGNFGLIYDMSAQGFVDYARINYGVIMALSEAEKFRDGFFRTYKNLKVWHKSSIMDAARDGFVRTLFGRKRHTPDIHSTDSFIRSNDERVAINSPVQGTAGEFTVFALYLLTNRLPKEVKLVNTVHDSIIFNVPKDKLAKTCRIIKDTCENLPTMKYFGAELKKVDMKVDIEYSDRSWGDLKPIDFEF